MGGRASVCDHYNRSHERQCRQPTLSCYQCQPTLSCNQCSQVRHYVKECPKAIHGGITSPMGGREDQRQVVQARVYALGEVDEDTLEIKEAGIIIGMDFLGLK